MTTDRTLHKELRPTAGAAGVGALAALAWSVWARSGSRLSLFVCIAALAALAVDLVWALVATDRVKVAVTGNPPEALVGDSVTLGLSVTGPRQFLSVSVPSLGADSPEIGVDVPFTGTVTGRASVREVLGDVIVEVVSHGLCGLVACARRRRVPLLRPLAVGPRPVPAEEPIPELLRALGDATPRPAATGDLVRGVRPYVPGDPVRRVHWRASARAGDLVVKEVEEPATARFVLVLDLGAGGQAGERAAGRAAWYAGEALRRGYEVTLSTAEGRLPVTRTVRSPSQITRRLAAAALPGHPDVPEDEPWVLVVTDRGDSWR